MIIATFNSDQLNIIYGSMMNIDFSEIQLIAALSVVMFEWMLLILASLCLMKQKLIVSLRMKRTQSIIRQNIIINNSKQEI